MTMLTRRPLLAAMLALTVAGSGAAYAAQDYRIMAPAGPGGGWDQTARALQNALVSAGVAKAIEVSNVSGAGGTIGLAKFSSTEKGKNDAMLIGGMVMVGAILTNKSPVTLNDVTPLARLTGEYQAIAVPAASPFKTLKDLADALKANPGKHAVAGGSAGGTDHITAGLLAKAVGVDPTKVNYLPHSGGGEALATMLSNSAAFGISGYGEFEGQMKAGTLRILAITAPQRLPGSDVPTAKEQGVDLVLANWRAVFGPPGISADQRASLLKAVDAAVASPQWKAVLKERNWDDQYLAGDAFVTYLKAEQTRIEGVLREVGLVK